MGRSLPFSFVLFLAGSLHAETLAMVVSEFKDATRLSPNLGPRCRGIPLGIICLIMMGMYRFGDLKIAPVRSR